MNFYNDAAIDRLKSALSLQLEAYLKDDWQTYEELEKQLLLIEKQL